MIRYLMQRAFETLLVLVALSVFGFALLELAPGDPAVKAAARGGRLPDAIEVQAYRQQLHLDDPVVVRYLRWAGNALRGDLGVSFDTNQSVADILRDTVPPTLLLVGLGLVIAWSLALVCGVAAGLRPGSLHARLLGIVAAILVGTPVFVLALIGLWLFAVTWPLFPTGGMTDPGAGVTVTQVLFHVALPAAVVGIGFFGWYARVIDAGVAGVRRQHFITTARAKGLPERIVVTRHLLRPALIPFITQVGASIGALVGGVYAVEVVFSWPGLGRTALRAAQLEDYPVVMALVLVTGLVVALGNLCADIGAAILDPRVTLGRRPLGG